MTSTNLKVSAISDLGCVESLSSEWSDLWERSVAKTPFQSPEWLLPWLRVFRPREPWILEVRDHSRLVGLAPLFIYAREGQRVVAMAGAGISDYCNWLIDKNHAVPVTAALFEFLQQHANRWDRLEFTDVPGNSTLLDKEHLRSGKRAISAYQACPIVQIPPEVTSFEDVIPRRRLAKLRKTYRHLNTVGERRVEVATPDTLPEQLDALLTLHGSRWSKFRMPGVLADDEVQSFHRQAAPGLIVKGILRLYALRLDHHIIAALYALADEEALYLYLQGFDTRYASYSPGLQIVGAAIEDALTLGKKKVDFLRGRESYKYGWGARDSETFQLQLTRIVSEVDVSRAERAA